jgi:MYXO-CTERM domain-containing protein
LLVEIDNLTDNDFVTGCKTAASLGAVATSISIGGPEGAGPNDEGGMDPTGYTTAGHLVVAATGDFGYNLINESAQAQSPGYPASAPDVLAVGGTTLFNSGSSYDEAVWNDGNFSTGQNGQDVTTSGCSTEWAAPSWQMASLSGTGCGNRATADVSAAAAFYQQGQLIDIAEYQQGWSNAEGTSAAAPMVAGLLTRLGLAEIISNNLAWPYTNPTGWNDLGSTSYPVDSSGSNTDSNDPSSCGKLCTAGPGWDGPSGLGTPNGAVLAMLAGLPQPPPEVDAGMPGSGTGTSSSSETTGMGAGNESSPGSGQGASAPLPGALGAACAHASDCDSKLCAEPSPGELAVCTQACTSSPSSCLFGFACMDGYCFAAPGAGGGTGTTTGDAGAGGSNDAPSSSGGCAVSPTSEDGPSSWAGFACLGLGLALLSQRRRSERDRA